MTSLSEIWRMSGNIIHLRTFSQKTLFIFAHSCTTMADFFQLLMEQLHDTIILCEKCFQPFNSDVSVMPSLHSHLCTQDHSLNLQASGWWTFSSANQVRSRFHFLSHFSDVHKQQVSFSYRRRTVGQKLKLDLAAALSLRGIFNKWDTNKTTESQSSCFPANRGTIWSMVCHL